MIYKDDLVDIWISEDFWIDCDDGIDVRNEGYSIIGTLIRASLLEEFNDFVKLHDVIRDMALWITKEDTLVVAGIQLKEVPSVRRWEGLRRLSLMESSIEKLIEVPTCPNLVTLLLLDNSRLYKISDDFFQFMGSITVLNLANCPLKELPRSISKLISLQYLNLQNTKVQELHMGLSTLKKLKYLNLNGLDLKVRKSERLISNLSSLQVLKMVHCSYCYGGEERDEEAYDGMLLQELQCLKHLNALVITIRCMSTLHKFFISDNLSTNTQHLCLLHLKGLKRLNISLLENIRHLCWLSIRGCLHLKEIRNDGGEERVTGSFYNSAVLEGKSLYNLQYVFVTKCHHLRELTWLILLPNLTQLYVEDCMEMEEIVSDEKLGEVMGTPQNLHPLSKLIVFQLQSLPQLKCIYQKPLPFLFLMRFEVYHCQRLKKVPVDRNSGKGCKIRLKAEKEWWEATKAAFLPRLQYVLR